MSAPTLFLIFLILGMVFGIVHGIYVHRFGNYLKKHHPVKWKEIEPKSFLWISQETLRSRNYFKEMGFVFSRDHLKDARVRSFKRRIKLFLLLTVLSWLLLFLSFFLVPI